MNTRPGGRLSELSPFERRLLYRSLVAIATGFAVACASVLVLPLAVDRGDPSSGGYAVAPALLLLALAVPVGGRMRPDERELAASLRAAAWAGLALLVLCLLVSALHLYAAWTGRPLGAFLHLLPVGAAVAMIGVHALAGLWLLREPRPAGQGRLLAVAGLVLLVAPFWYVVALALDVGREDRAAVSAQEQAEWRIEGDAVAVTSRIDLRRWTFEDETLELDLYLPVEAGEMQAARLGGSAGGWEELPLQAAGHGAYRLQIPRRAIDMAAEGGGPLMEEARLVVDWRMPLAAWGDEGDPPRIRLRSLLPVDRYALYLALEPDDAWRFVDGDSGRRKLFSWWSPGARGGLHFGTMTLPIEPCATDRSPPEAP